MQIYKKTWLCSIICKKKLFKIQKKLPPLFLEQNLQHKNINFKIFLLFNFLLIYIYYLLYYCIHTVDCLLHIVESIIHTVDFLFYEKIFFFYDLRKYFIELEIFFYDFFSIFCYVNVFSLIVVLKISFVNFGGRKKSCIFDA